MKMNMNCVPMRRGKILALNKIIADTGSLKEIVALYLEIELNRL